MDLSPAPRRPRARPARRPRRWAAAWWLLPVLLLHLLALHGLSGALRMPEPGSLPPVLYTQVLLPQAPMRAPVEAAPAAARAPAPATRITRPTVVVPSGPPAARRAAHAPPPGRSAVAHPEPAAPAASRPAPLAASAPAAPPAPTPRQPSASSAEAAGAAAAASTAAPPAAVAAPAWPVSTRLEYALHGYYRGALHGDGELQWQRDGTHYQLRLAGSALIDFSYTSTGGIERDWLAPQRYVERVLLNRKIVDFDRAAGLLRFSAIPSTLPIPAHLQDSASVFMQLAQLLHTRPQEFRTGSVLPMQVARPSGTTRWDFRVAGRETVDTGVGPLECWHLVYDPPPDADLGAAVWLAPALQGLPVQIRLQRGADEFLLFTLRRALQQAPAAPASAAASAAPSAALAPRG